MAFQIEELINRYKIMPIWTRLAGAFLLGIIPALYYYIDEGAVKETEKEERQREVEVLKKQFDKYKDSKEKLPILKSKLTFTDEQMKQVTAKLPEDIHIEQILKKVAVAAKDSRVELMTFDPQGEKKGEGALKYKELPIRLEYRGKFKQAVAFLDKLVHFEEMVHVRDLEIISTVPNEQDKEKPGEVTQEQKEMTPEERARDARYRLIVSVKAEMVVFRSMSLAEIAEEKKAEENEKSKENKGNKPKKTNEDS